MSAFFLDTFIFGANQGYHMFIYDPNFWEVQSFMEEEFLWLRNSLVHLFVILFNGLHALRMRELWHVTLFLTKVTYISFCGKEFPLIGYPYIFPAWDPISRLVVYATCFRAHILCQTGSMACHVARLLIMLVINWPCRPSYMLFVSPEPCDWLNSVLFAVCC